MTVGTGQPPPAFHTSDPPGREPAAANGFPPGQPPEGHVQAGEDPRGGARQDERGQSAYGRSGASSRPHRPARPARGPGRWLRSLTGVSEIILDWAPEERPRYTRLGAILLNAGLLAALSMLVALEKFVDAPLGVLLVIAALWGWVIVSIDTWLISSTHGTRHGASAWIFVVRLMLSVVIGLVIAEPLLLKVFEPAIHRQVAADRVQERLGKESALRACNPVPYRRLDDATASRCAAGHLLLTVTSSPAAQAVALKQTEDQQAKIRKQLDAAAKKLAAAEDLAARECAGKTGAGLSGRVGKGPNCDHDRKVARQIRADSKTDQYQAGYARLQSKIDTLTSQQKDAEQTYDTQIDEAIKAKLPPTEGKIGILEEDKALGRLSAESAFVLVAQWLVRLLLVIVDCLPILTKKLAGSSTYDTMVDRQMSTNEDLYEAEDELNKQRDMAVKRIGLKQSERFERQGIEKVEAQDEADRSRQEAELNERIDALAAELRRKSTA
ncbi:DUF4407 domain-containing protein [Sphaerisporangium viridialbum]|uniref:DUF4407 domain-containing protein n=1 Tax=Sphaerisporangium viridialbum TaxID=46189 RepID=UPI003C76BF31